MPYLPFSPYKKSPSFVPGVLNSIFANVGRVPPTLGHIPLHASKVQHGTFLPPSGGKTSAKPTSGGYASPPSSAQSYATVSPKVDYLHADLAEHYGMSNATAYQEALSNTAFQRQVKDMQAAGLNPAVLFGAGSPGSGADGVAYASDGTSGYSGAGYSSARSYGSSNKYSSKNDRFFSNSAYAIISALGGIVGAAATKSAGGYWIGTSMTQAAMHVIDSIF